MHQPHVLTALCLACLRSPGIRTPTPALLGGEVSNLDLGLQRTPCCRYTTPDRRNHATSGPASDPAALHPSSQPAGPGSKLPGAMGSLIKKRRKRMRKKKHKKLLKRTRWQRRQQGR